MKYAVLTSVLITAPLFAAEPAPAAPTVEQLQAGFRKLGFPADYQSAALFRRINILSEMAHP